MSARTGEAVAALAAPAPAMAGLVERFGTVDFVARFRRRVPAIAGDPFVALLRSIVGQQLSTTSAEAIFGRFRALAGGRPLPAPRRRARRARRRPPPGRALPPQGRIRARPGGAGRGRPARPQSPPPPR